MPAAAPPDLITVDYFKALYGDTGVDAQLDIIIPAVSLEVKRFTRRDFYTATYTDYFDGGGMWGQKFLLSQFPVVSLTTVHSDVTRAFGSLSVIASGNYRPDLKRGILYMNPNVMLEPWLGNIKVTYTAGFGATVDDLPEDIKMATAMWCAVSLKGWQNDQLGLTSARQGDVSVVFDRGRPPKGVRDTLVRIRDRAFIAA